MTVRHTSCRYCGQDIEGWAPYRKGEWRDRGNNSQCPTPEGDKGLHHAPFRPGVDDRAPAIIPARYRAGRDRAYVQPD